MVWRVEFIGVESWWGMVERDKGNELKRIRVEPEEIRVIPWGYKVRVLNRQG